MAKGVTAALGAGVAVFAFDPGPETPAPRALQVLTVRRGLPRAELEARERFSDAALRALTEAGLPGVGRRSGRAGQALRLVTLDEDTARSRAVTAWYYTTLQHMPLEGPGAWAPVGRGSRLEGRDGEALRAAIERLRADTRQLAGAAALLGEVFTGDDLLRLHVALHGGPEGSERTFRRRIQELRDGGVLKPVRDSEVAALRQRVSRFRSPAGTGGRPPELLRYAGSGGEDERLASLRARRSA